MKPERGHAGWKSLNKEEVLRQRRKLISQNKVTWRPSKHTFHGWEKLLLEAIGY